MSTEEFDNGVFALEDLKSHGKLLNDFLSEVSLHSLPIVLSA